MPWLIELNIHLEMLDRMKVPASKHMGLLTTF